MDQWKGMAQACTSVVVGVVVVATVVVVLDAVIAPMSLVNVVHRSRHPPIVGVGGDVKNDGGVDGTRGGCSVGGSGSVCVDAL